MALYIDSAFLPDIKDAARTVPAAGVTTNPSILLAARERGQSLSPQDILRELLQILDGLIFMQPGSIEQELMYEQAMAYIALSPARVIPKIPMTQVGMRVAKRLKQQGQRVAFTAVTSVAQAYSAAMIGADYLIPYYNRLERSGIDASERVSEIADLLHNQHLPSRLMVASIKSPAEAAAALLAGAQDLTAAPEVLMDMISDPLSEQAVEKFVQDWQKLNKL